MQWEPRISRPRDAPTRSERQHFVRIASASSGFPPFPFNQDRRFLNQNTLGSPGSLAVSQHPSPRAVIPHRARVALKTLDSQLGLGSPIAGVEGLGCL